MSLTLITSENKKTNIPIRNLVLTTIRAERVKITKFFLEVGALCSYGFFIILSPAALECVNYNMAMVNCLSVICN